jgi:hypothetical protein
MFILIAKMIGIVSKFVPLIKTIDENSTEFTKIYDAPNNESYISFEEYKFAKIKSVKCVYYNPQTINTADFIESKTLCALTFRRSPELTMSEDNPFESNEIEMSVPYMFECKISNKYFFVLRYELDLKYRNFEVYRELEPLLTNDLLVCDFLSCKSNILQFLIQTGNNKIFYEMFPHCVDLSENIQSLLIKAISCKNIEIMDFILQQKIISWVKFWSEVVIKIMDTQDIELFKKYINFHVENKIVIKSPIHIRELLGVDGGYFQ